jgi:hypothetical protein
MHETLKIEQRKLISCLIIFLLSLVSVFGQGYYKVVYEQDTFYTFNTTAFFDSSFEKPNSVPDGKWIILSNDTLPIYVFNTSYNCIDGEYTEYWDGFLRAKGAYRMDSLWTFRFNNKDDRFKDGNWLNFAGMIMDTTNHKVVGFEMAYNLTYNNFYPNGVRQYEKRGQQVEIWYYPTGTMKAMTTNYENDGDDIIVEQSFDSIGRLSKIVTTRRTTIIKNKVNVGGIFVSSNTVEYNGSWKAKEIIDDNKYITTIYYGDVGQEIKRTREKKVKSKTRF